MFQPNEPTEAGASLPPLLRRPRPVPRNRGHAPGASGRGEQDPGPGPTASSLGCSYKVGFTGHPAGPEPQLGRLSEPGRESQRACPQPQGAPSDAHLLWDPTQAVSGCCRAMLAPQTLILALQAGMIISFLLKIFFFKDFIYLNMRDTHREGETRAEGEGGSLRGARRGTRSLDPKIRP